MISLAGGEVHIWRASLEAGEPVLAASWKILAEHEKARAERFHFERDKRRFILARAGLRTLLAEYSDLPAGAIPLEYGPSGKPGLPGSFALEFNLSHSLDAALFAVSGHAVGVDLEAIRPVQDALSVAERFFTSSEIAALHLEPPERLSEAFLRFWTRKEASLKASGHGLSDDDPGPGTWRIYDIDAGPGFLAALAVDCVNAKLVEPAAGTEILTTGPVSTIFRYKGLEK